MLFVVLEQLHDMSQSNFSFFISEAVAGTCSMKKLFLPISQNS